MSSHPRHQHYVPRLLLRGFVQPGTSKLSVLNKRSRKIYTAAIDDAGAESWFNDAVPGKPDTSLEASYGRMENAAAPLIYRIREERSIGWLQPEQVAALAIFAAAQDVRTPRHREQYIDGARRIHEWASDMGASMAKAKGVPYDEASFRLPSDDQLRAASLDVVGLVGKLAELICEKSWLLFEAPEGQSFYCSDHPVTKQNAVDHGWRGNLGYTSRGVEIYLPISSRLTLGFMCPSIEASMRESAAKIRVIDPLLRLSKVKPHERAAIERIRVTTSEFIAGVETGVPVRLLPENVIRLNSLQVSQSERCLYASQPDFTLALEMLRRHPHLEQGPRFEIGWGGAQKDA